MSNAPEEIQVDPPAMDEPTQFFERLREAIGGGSVRAFGRMAGVSEKMLRQYLAGKSDPTRKVLVALASAGNVSVDWLATGRGPKEVQRPPRQPLDLGRPEVRQGLTMPLYFSGDGPVEVMVPEYDVCAGMGNGGVNPVERLTGRWYMAEETLKGYGPSPGNACIIRVSGDSMEPTLSDGDRVLVDRSLPGLSANAVYVLRIGDYLYAKRLQKMADGSVLIKSDNPAYETDQVPAAEAPQLYIVGRVVARFGGM